MSRRDLTRSHVFSFLSELFPPVLNQDKCQFSFSLKLPFSKPSVMCCRSSEESCCERGDLLNVYFFKKEKKLHWLNIATSRTQCLSHLFLLPLRKLNRAVLETPTKPPRFAIDLLFGESSLARSVPPQFQPNESPAQVRNGKEERRVTGTRAGGERGSKGSGGAACTPRVLASPCPGGSEGQVISSNDLTVSSP